MLPEATQEIGRIERQANHYSDALAGHVEQKDRQNARYRQEDREQLRDAVRARAS